MADFFRFLVESNLTTASFVIGALALIIAIIGRIKTIIEPSPAMRFVLALFGLSLMGLSFVGYVGFRPVVTQEPLVPASPTSQISQQVTQQPSKVPTLVTQEPLFSPSPTSQTSQQVTQQPSKAPIQPTQIPTLPPLNLAEGELVYEDEFDNPSGWNVEEGMSIENGSLIVWPGYDAVPKAPDTYADFIFESRFYIPLSGSMAFYLRHQRPPCQNWNCSVQIALYFNNTYQELAARRFQGDKPSQQVDLKKTRISALNSPGWNTMVVQAKGSLYAVYINDIFVFDFADDVYTSGAFIIDNAPGSSGEIKVDYIRIFQIP